MTKAIIYIGVIILIVCSGAVPAFALTFGNFPRLSMEDSSEQSVSMPMDRMEVDLSQPLTLRQCIEIAQKNASRIRTAQLNLVLQDMNVKDRISQYFPQIDTSGGYQFSDDVDFGWERENYNASVTARYTIWDHGQRRANYAQAKLRRDSEYTRYGRTGQNLIFDIIIAYYDVLEAEKLIAVGEESLKQSRNNVDKIKAFVEVGYAIEADVSTARVQQASDELAVINDRNNLELAKADLAVLMGMNPDVDFSILDEPDYEKYIQTGLIDMEEISVDDAVSQALIERSEMEESKANKAVLKWSLMLAQLDRWPRITADCDYSLRLDDYLRERDALKNHKSWNVSARVSYPIFDGGRSSRTVQRAEIAIQQVDESLLALERSIALEVYQSYISLERTRKSLDITSVQVEDAKMSLDVTQGRYDQQMIILLELLDAQARYAQSLTNQVRAFYDYKVATGSLQKAMGVLQ